MAGKRSYFGTSGIRGIINEALTPELALKVGRAIGSYLEQGPVVIGMDTRTSGEMIKSAVISGLLSAGMDVVDIGIAPTPLTGFAIKLYGAEAGVTVTASHNPPEYNGIKVWQSNGMAYTPDMEEEIEDIIRSGNFRKAAWNEIGKLKLEDPRDAYIEAVKRRIKLRKSYRVVVDTGNGAGSLISPLLQRELGNSAISLNGHPSGFFSRELELNADSLSNLSETVRVTEADLGIAHDGDADRIGVVDDEGNFVDYETMLSLISRYVIEKYGGKKVVTTVDAGMALGDYLKPLGVEIIRTRVGDVAVAEAIEREGAAFGGEPSGTWIIPQWNLTPDGIFAGALVVEMIDRLGPISELREKVPHYFTMRRKISCPNEKKEEALREIRRKIEKEFSYDYLIDIDGIRIEGEGWWILIRPSGTEPIMRITLEAHTEEKARELMERAERIVKRAISMAR